MVPATGDKTMKKVARELWEIFKELVIPILIVNLICGVPLWVVAYFRMTHNLTK